MQGIWERNTAKHSSGETYRIGKIVVGKWFNAIVSKGQPSLYRAMLDLPGLTMKPDTIDHPTPEAARARVERAVATWFAWLEQQP